MKTIEERGNDYAKREICHYCGYADFVCVRCKDYLDTKKHFTKGATDERAIFDNLPKMRAWVARDKDGRAFLYSEKPYKEGAMWSVRDYTSFMYIDNDNLPEGCNPQWEDDEPIEIEITLSMKGGKK